MRNERYKSEFAKFTAFILLLFLFFTLALVYADFSALLPSKAALQQAGDRTVTPFGKPSIWPGVAALFAVAIGYMMWVVSEYNEHE